MQDRYIVQISMGRFGVCGIGAANARFSPGEPAGPCWAINVSLNEDLVRQARLYTRNLSGTLEDLLEDFVLRERARRRDADAALNRVVDAFSALHTEHGLLSDEFSAL
jgi:antitoxin CcdA